jgi:hypothetical protein
MSLPWLSASMPVFRLFYNEKHRTVYPIFADRKMQICDPEGCRHDALLPPNLPCGFRPLHDSNYKSNPLTHCCHSRRQLLLELHDRSFVDVTTAVICLCRPWWCLFGRLAFQPHQLWKVGESAFYAPLVSILLGSFLENNPRDYYVRRSYALECPVLDWYIQ